MTERNWEKELSGQLYDLPPERWAALEYDLLRRLHEPVPAPRPWWRRLGESLGGLMRRPAVLGGAAAMLALAAGAGWWLTSSAVPVPSAASLAVLPAWQDGQTLRAATPHRWNWTAARCTLELNGSVRRLPSADGVHLRLEDGSIRLSLAPRRAGENFSVDFASCRATVVGTAFQLRVDSAGGSAHVEHGKVRVQTAGGWQRLLLKGDSWVCQEPVAVRAVRSAQTPTAVSSVSAPAVSAPSASLEDLAWDSLQAHCHGEGSACLEALADYLNHHPRGARAAQAGRRWAAISRRQGDLRDALFALDLAANAGAGELSQEARLDACALRIEELHQYREGEAALNSLLAGLPERSPLRSKALELRKRTEQPSTASPSRDSL